MSGLPRVGSLRAVDNRTRPEIVQSSLFNEIRGIRGNPVKGEVLILLKEYFFVIHFYVATRAPRVTLSKGKTATHLNDYLLSEFQSVPENNVFLETKETRCK